MIQLLSNKYGKKAADLILPIQRIEFGVPITLEDQPDLLNIDEYYLKPGGGFWGAIENDELIGTIAMLNVGHHTGVIRKMFVKKEFRGKTQGKTQGKTSGIAQKLIETLIDYSREKGITDLYLGTVDKMKAAHRFYERNGFKKIDETDLPTYFPRMALDNTFYHLTIDQ